MNRQQRNYAMAKALHESLFKEKIEHETKWLKNHGRNEKYLFKIEDYEIRDVLCEEYQSDEERARIDEDYHESIDALQKAEDDLISFGLSVIPNGLVDTIKRGLKTHRIRERFIDITFRLNDNGDADGVKAELTRLYNK